MPDTANSFLKAINDARKEHGALLETLKEYEKTRTRVAQLEAFIDLGMTLLEITTKEDNQPGSQSSLLPTEITPTPSQPPTGEVVMPLKEGVLQILRESGKEMSLGELADGFHKRHWKLSEKNGRQVLRGTVQRFPELLIKTVRGAANTAYYKIK